MALSERLQYILDFNTQGAIKGLQQLGKTADTELGKAEARLDKLGANFTKFGAGAVAFAGVAGAGLVKLASGAAEAEANTAALRQVVDEVSASQIEEWAKGSAVAVGLASKEAIAATTGFAGLGKIIGLSGPELAGFSTSLVQMAADMAAFKDVSPQQALADLQSLFAGSTEVGRKYNIFLDDATLKSAYFRETGERVTGTLTAQQRIIATNSELYRQGADMIGQWGRESDGLAGQQAQLRANLINLGDAIGAGVLPMLTELAGAANWAAQKFAGLDPEVQSTIGKFAALGVAGAGLVGTLSIVAGQLIKMRDRFTTLDIDTKTRSLNNFGKAAVVTGAALGVAGLALTAYTVNQEQNAKSLADAVDLFGKIGRAADEQIAGALQGALILADLGGQSAAEAMRTFAQSNLEAARRALETGAAAQISADVARELAAAIAEEEKARKQATLTTEEYGDKVEEVAEKVGSLAIANDGASKSERDYIQWQLQRAGLTDEQIAAEEELAAAREEAAERGREALTRDIEAHQQWRQSINESTDSGEQAFQDFTDKSFESIEAFQAKLAESIVNTAEWKNNLVAIGAQTSPEFAAYLAELGPAAADVVAELAGNTPELERTFGLWSASAGQGARDIIGEMQSLQAEAEAAGMTVGEYLASGMDAGIAAGIPNVENRAREAVRRAAVAAKEAAQIASPSKVWQNEIGLQMMLGLANGILAGTPEAMIDAAEAANQISAAAADEMRDNLRAEKEARDLAERIGEAFVDELEAQQDAAVDAAERMVDAAADKMSAAWDQIGDRFSLEDAREAVSDAERDVERARAALQAGQADPETTADELADLQERLSDQERALQRDNLRLFRQLVESGVSPMGYGAEQTALRAIGAAAGLTHDEMLSFALAQTDANNANMALGAAQTAPITVAQQQQAFEAALSKFFTPGNTFQAPPLETVLQALGSLIEEIERRRRNGA